MYRTKLVGSDHVLSFSRAMDMVWILTDQYSVHNEDEGYIMIKPEFITEI